MNYAFYIIKLLWKISLDLVASLEIIRFKNCITVLIILMLGGRIFWKLMKLSENFIFYRIS